MQIRRLTIERFRGIEEFRVHPGPRTVILGPNNAGKSTVLEALDLLLHPGLGRPRPTPDELDYFRRDPAVGFEVEAVIGDLSRDFQAQVHLHLEGWRMSDTEVVPEPDGEGVEPVIRVRVRGNPELELAHEFAKPESEGTPFHRALREPLAWVFDGRTWDAKRQLSFYQGGLLDRLCADADLDPAILALREALADGANAVNSDQEVDSVLTELSGDLVDLGLLVEGDAAEFESGAVSRRLLLQTLRLALPSVDEVLIPLMRHGRGVQRLVLVAVLLRIARAAGVAPIVGFEEPEEALEPLRQAQLAEMMLEIAHQGGQLFVVTHSPDMARCFGIEDIATLDVTTFVPVFLLLYGLSDDDLAIEDRRRALGAIESWLVRRAIIRGTTKDYNKVAPTLVGRIKGASSNPADAVVSWLREAQGDAREWPSDERIREELTTAAIYTSLKRARLIMILEAVEKHLRRGLSEQLTIGSGLHVEHVLPQSWQQHWPVAQDDDALKREIERDGAKHRLGNLTLVTAKLNSTESNRPWEEKRELLREHSLLKLSQTIVEHDTWDEERINYRSGLLADTILEVWPGPDSEVWSASTNNS